MAPVGADPFLCGRPAGTLPAARLPERLSLQLGAPLAVMPKSPKGEKRPAD